MRPALRTEYLLLRQYDGRGRFLSPQLAAMADWLVYSLSAPFDGESEEAYRRAAAQDGGHGWGVLAPGKGPRRVHPPQGAHSERRVPPRSLWYLGNCLHRYQRGSGYQCGHARQRFPDEMQLPSSIFDHNVPSLSTS